MIGRSPDRREQKHMLDIAAEQNIGNGNIIYPQAGSATVIPQTNPERILRLSGPSSAGQTTSVILTASRIVGSQNPNPGYPGPITGVIEFGNGGQFTRAEVDIPVGPFSGSIAQATNAVEPQDGGVIVTVPTGVLRVYARYDNQLLALSIDSSPPQSLAQYLALSPIAGPGGPVVRPTSLIPAEPVLVKAMTAYFSRHTSKVFRTQYVYVSDLSTGVPIPVTPQGIYCIPPFARSVRILRNPLASAMNVNLFDNANHILNQVPVPPNASPSIPLEGTETLIGLVSSAANQVSLLAFCYEIGI